MGLIINLRPITLIYVNIKKQANPMSNFVNIIIIYYDFARKLNIIKI